MMTEEETPYEGPYAGDLDELSNEEAETEAPPQRTGIIKPRTLPDALAAAHRLGLEPYTSENGRWIGFDCPTCKTLGKKAAATVAKDPRSGILIPECFGCYDQVPPGILETLGTITPTKAETNGTPTNARQLVELLNLDDLLANPPPDPDFAWGNTQGGYIEIGTLAVLHGDGGLGKSLIGQGLCRRYTLAREWLNQTTPGGTALYLDGENSLAEIARRLYAFEFRPGEQHLKYGRVSFPILLDPTAGEKLINELVAETGCTLLVLDSQRALWGGDEREQLEVRPMYDMLARAAERLQIAILLIHHDNKSGLYSGSTDINAAVGSRIHLERFNPKDRKDRRRILWHEKSRSGPEQEPVVFSVDKTPDGLLTFEISDEDTDTEPPGRPRSDMGDRILNVLSDHTPRTRSEVAHALHTDHTNRTLRRHWNLLIDQGQITSTDNQHWGTT